MTSGPTAPKRSRETRKQRVRRYLTRFADYCAEALKIVTKQGQMRPLVLNFAQQHCQDVVARQLAETGRVRVIILKARQEGISTWVAARVFRRITMRRHQNALVVADQNKRGATLFGIYDRFRLKLPADLLPRIRYTNKGQQLWFDTPTGGGLGSKLNVGTAKDVNTGRSDAIQILHASEFAFWENAEDVWIGLAQSIPDVGSEVYIESTANGVGNLFHSMWKDAETGDSEYIAIFLPWWVHEEYRLALGPDAEAELRADLSLWEQRALVDGLEWEGSKHPLTIEQIAWRRRKIRTDFRGDERGFRQEYPATAREAFLTSGACYFDEDVLAAYEDMSVETPIAFRGDLQEYGGRVAPARIERGPLRIWRFPETEGHYVIFADTAEGRLAGREREGTAATADSERGGRDYSCAWVFDVVRRSYVAQLHGRMASELFAEKLAMLGQYFSCRTVHGTRQPALIGVEVNHSSGETTARTLRVDLAYPHMYFHKLINRRNNRPTSKLGWFTTEENRDPMLAELAGSLRENSIWLPDADTIRECFTFVRDDRGKPAAQDGCHDDRVIAAAGALQLARVSQPARKVEYPKVPIGDSPSGVMSYGS